MLKLFSAPESSARAIKGENDLAQLNSAILQANWSYETFAGEARKA